jgi:hypothetical protein
VKDPHTHSPHDLFMPHGQLRDLITSATGLAFDMPKTIRTGCDRRRPMASTSLVPESVTCLPCREYAAGYYSEQARMAESLLAIPAGDSIWASGKVTPESLAESAREDRAKAARFGAVDLEAGQ